MDYPLSDLKVLDFSRVLAGPFAGRMLSDLGADVVKVEPPDGDITRYWGREVANLPGYFVQQNAGKRNICLDLRAPDAADLVKRMVQEADIVIENYRPDVMGRLGIGYEDLAAVNEKIIMLSISGFGHNGPESRRATYAPVIHAEAGLIYRNTQRNDVVLHDMPLSVADTNAALHGLVGLLSALHMRERTGKGQHIDIAMIDATVATDDQMAFDLEDANSTRSLPNEIWETPIGPVLLSTDFRVFFKSLTTILGLEDPATPDMSLEEKIKHRRAAVKDFIQTLDTRDKFVEAMRAMNIAWGDVRNPATVHDQPTVAARGTIAEIDDREGGKRPVVQSPYRFSDAASGVRGPAAHRGEHNIEVISEWLQLSEAEAEALMRSDAIVPYDPEWRHH